MECVQRPIEYSLSYPWIGLDGRSGRRDTHAGDRRDQKSHLTVLQYCHTQMSIASHAGAKRCAAERPQSVGAAQCVQALQGPQIAARELLKNYQRSAAMRTSGSPGRPDRSLARRKRRKRGARDDLSNPHARIQINEL